MPTEAQHQALAALAARIEEFAAVVNAGCDSEAAANRLLVEVLEATKVSNELQAERRRATEPLKRELREVLDLYGEHGDRLYALIRRADDALRAWDHGPGRARRWLQPGGPK